MNAGTVGSYPQAAVPVYLGATAIISVKNIAAGTTGSVYNGSLTVTPLTAGDNKGAFAWTGTGFPGRVDGGRLPGDVPREHAAAAGFRRGPVRRHRLRGICGPGSTAPTTWVTEGEQLMTPQLMGETP